MNLTKLALTLAAVPALGLTLPALAQDAAPAPAPAADAALPTCSATVTDNCMQRAWHAPAKHAKHPGKKGHHGGKHHHK